jgi:hypothetical protein
MPLRTRNLPPAKCRVAPWACAWEYRRDGARPGPRRTRPCTVPRNDGMIASGLTGVFIARSPTPNQCQRSDLRAQRTAALPTRGISDARR